MKINHADSFNEKCDKVLFYLKGIAESNTQVQELIKMDRLILDTGIKINDPVINFLSYQKKFIDIHMQNGYIQISSAGMAFISHSSFVKEQIKSDTEGLLKWYETENAKQIFDDYQNVKSRTIRSEWIAIFALIVAAIGLILQWINNKND